MMKQNKYSFKKKAIILGLAALIIGFSGAYPQNGNGETKSNDWSQWRGPNRNGVSNEDNLLKQWPESGPEIIWKKTIGEGYSGISVSDGKLYTMWDAGKSQFLFCLDIKTGEEIWKTKTGKSFVDGWGNGPRSTPVVDENIVYTVSPDGDFFAMNCKNGKVIWTHDLHEEFDGAIPGYGYSSSPLIDGNVVYIEAGGKKDYLYLAFNKITGNLLWHSQTDEPAYSSPIAISVNGERQIVFMSAGGLNSLSPVDGSLLWHYDWNARCPSSGIPVNTIAPLFIAPDRIFVSGGFGTITGAAMIIIKQNGGEWLTEKIWGNDNMNNLLNPSIFNPDHIFGFDDRILKCLDADTGEELWQQSGYKRGSLIAADDLLFVLGENGKLGLVEANPDKFNELSSAQILDGRCWTGPTMSDGKLYLRNNSELVCVNVAGLHGSN